MDSITTIPGKLFYTIYKLGQEKSLNSREKGILKDLVIQYDPEILSVYDKYVKQGTEMTLRSDLLAILRQSVRSPRFDEKQNTGDAKSEHSSIIRIKPDLKLIIPKTMVQKLPAGQDRLS